jgi:hypothetical protein
MRNQDGSDGLSELGSSGAQAFHSGKSGKPNARDLSVIQNPYIEVHGHKAAQDMACHWRLVLLQNESEHLILGSSIEDKWLEEPCAP